MTEIEKMFENADIKQDRMCEWTCKDSETCNLNCKHYGSTKEFYPPFTAEKQIELICLLSKREMYINQRENTYYIFTMTMGGSNVGKTIDEALAKYINFHWQDLTDQEKEKIRGILNEH